MSRVFFLSEQQMSSPSFLLLLLLLSGVRGLFPLVAGESCKPASQPASQQGLGQVDRIKRREREENNHLEITRIITY